MGSQVAQQVSFSDMLNSLWQTRCALVRLKCTVYMRKIHFGLGHSFGVLILQMCHKVRWIKRGIKRGAFIQKFKGKYNKIASCYKGALEIQQCKKTLDTRFGQYDSYFDLMTKF